MLEYEGTLKKEMSSWKQLKGKLVEKFSMVYRQKKKCYKTKIISLMYPLIMG